MVNAPPESDAPRPADPVTNPLPEQPPLRRGVDVDGLVGYGGSPEDAVVDLSRRIGHATGGMPWRWALGPECSPVMQTGTGEVVSWRATGSGRTT